MSLPSTQASGLRDDLQDGGVDDEVGQAGLPGDAGVDDGGAGGAGGVQQRLDDADDVAFDGLGGEEAAEGAVGVDDVLLQVHGDDGGAGGVEFHSGSPLR